VPEKPEGFWICLFERQAYFQFLFANWKYDKSSNFCFAYIRCNYFQRTKCSPEMLLWMFACFIFPEKFDCEKNFLTPRICPGAIYSYKWLFYIDNDAIIFAQKGFSFLFKYNMLRCYYIDKNYFVANKQKNLFY